MVTTCIGLLNTGYNNNAWNYNGYNMCRFIEYSSDAPWNWFIEICEFQVMSNCVGHSFLRDCIAWENWVGSVLEKIWEAFQFHVKYVGSILTFCRTSAVRMCDCSLTLHPGFSLTITPGTIIMGCLFFTANSVGSVLLLSCYRPFVVGQSKYLFCLSLDFEFVISLNTLWLL